MLPLTLLNTAKNAAILVELKNGETYNGHLVNCDNFMNILLKEVVCTSPEGDRFWRLDGTYIRGSVIKYLRIPDEIIEKVQEDRFRQGNRGGRGGGRGGFHGGRGSQNRGGGGRGGGSGNSRGRGD